MHRRVALLVLLVGSVASSGTGAAAPIDLPLRTWVSRPLPKPGQGPCPYQCKHMRMAVNTLNGRIYFEGGDYSTNTYFDSGRQETYSYSIADNTWVLEYPYCAPPGEYQPSHPDEVTWVWDTRRQMFWMVPGYMGGEVTCTQTPAPVRGKVMSFNPVTRKWSLPAVTQPADAASGIVRNGTYDPVTDTIIRMIGTPCRGVSIYEIQNDRWSSVCFPNFNADLGFEYQAIDVAGRAVYVIDPFGQQLYRYNIEARTITRVAGLPVTAEPYMTRIAWDSVNKVLLWVIGGGCSEPYPTTTAWAFHPGTGSWESLPLTQPEGLAVSGNNLVYDPGQNALLLMGCPSAEFTGKFFLYRYGNGDGSAPADSIPPFPPQNLRTR